MNKFIHRCEPMKNVKDKDKQFIGKSKQSKDNNQKKHRHYLLYPD